MALKEIKFNRSLALAAAQASTDKNTVYFTTDSHQIVMGGVVYDTDTTYALATASDLGLVKLTDSIAHGATATDTVPSVHAVCAAIDDLQSHLTNAMIFRGTVGTNGTISTLPTASANKCGDTYKVITDGAGGTGSKVGDTVVCFKGGTAASPTYEWVIIPSGDEPAGTVTQISAGDGLTTGGDPITTIGTISLSDTTKADIAKGVTANGWGNHADAGYVTDVKIGETSLKSGSVATIPVATASALGVVKVGSVITSTDGYTAVVADSNGKLYVADSAAPGDGQLQVYVKDSASAAGTATEVISMNDSANVAVTFAGALMASASNTWGTYWDE